MGTKNSNNSDTRIINVFSEAKVCVMMISVYLPSCATLCIYRLGTARKKVTV